MHTHRRTNTAWAAVVIVTLMGGVTIAAPARAQNTAPPSTRVSDVVAQFPAGSPMQRDALARQLLAAGASGIAEVTRRLAPSGAGDDVSVRFALNGLAVFASRFGSDDERSLVERGLADALGRASDAGVRTFLLAQLQLVGRDAAVLEATPLLADPELFEPATQLMLSVRSAAAKDALAAALPKAKGPALVALVKAAGELRIASAHDRLASLAADANPGLRRVALAGLARLANPQSYSTLTSAAAKVKFGYDAANATAALLDYAKNIAAAGDVGTAERVCRLVLKQPDGPGRTPSKAAALAVLAGARGHDALPRLIAAMDSPDRAYRSAALGAADPLRGVAAIRRWEAKARAVDAERRAEIVAMLGRQGDRQALPFLRASLAAPEPAVVVAAADAVARIDGADAAPRLVPLLKAAPDAARARLVEILLAVLDDRHLDGVAALLNDGAPAAAAARAAAIGILGARNGRGFSEVILAFTTDKSAEVRAAAYGALAGVATPADLPALLRMLDSADAETAPAVQKAIVAAVARTPADASGSAPLVQALKSSAHPDRILEVLPQVGGGRALAGVVEQFGSATGDVKAAAFKALTRWPGVEATSRLLAIVASGDETYRNQAFSAFVRQVTASALTPEQKVLALRKVMPQVSTGGDRRILIRALDRLRTFQSVLLVVPFLDDADVASDAAAAAMHLALPTAPGARDGLTGPIARAALTKAIGALKGQQADADRESIRAWLAAMPGDEGFVPMFNGRDLTGWQGLVGNPISRAKMSPVEMATRQLEADAKARANWGVKDGAIVFNGAGDNLCSIKEYGDFEMVVDWRITKDGDSGIYLRGSPQVQIWDNARTDVGAEVGSGGLYNNQRNPSKPLARVDNPVGEWNTFRIVMIGDRVTVYFNGIKVVDNVTLENYWDRKQPIFPRGPIELQAHGTDLAFRDIYVRELTGAGYGMTEEERADGFVSLFDGRTLDGWTGNETGYRVEDGAMVFDPKAGDSRNLYTAAEYGDFQLRFEFQLTPAANSGVGIRAPRSGDAAYVGMEIQVLDDTAPVYAALQPYQYHGSVYGVIPAKRGLLKPVGEWNSEEILIRGSRIRITLNGTVIVDGDLEDAARNGTMDHRDHPGLARTSGAIGWLSHDSVVRFRSIRIKSLWPPPAPR